MSSEDTGKAAESSAGGQQGVPDAKPTWKDLLISGAILAVVSAWALGLIWTAVPQAFFWFSIFLAIYMTGVVIYLVYTIRKAEQ